MNEWRSKEHAPEKYLLFWKKTQKTRLKNIEDIESLQQILELWPEYKQHNAVEFVSIYKRICMYVTNLTKLNNLYTLDTYGFLC